MSIPPVERNPIQWTNTQGANLYSTGASGPAAIRPVHPVNAVESTDKLGEGVTVTIKSPERPKEPLYKQLIEHIQSMWRASAMAVEVFEQAQKTDQQERNMQQVRNEPLTYEEPRVKRTGGL